MMALEKPDSDEQLAADVNAWLDANWDDARRCEKGADKLDVRSWLTKLLESGYAVPTWSPEWFGLGLGSKQGRIIDRILKARNVIGRSQDRYNLGAVTVYRLGSPELKQELLRDMLTGSFSCLLYSEPNAGSDLAGVRTKAEWQAGPDGGEYVITGQKVWTSNATEATYGMLLARSDWDVPKHSGITFFIFPMKQPGVEIRPINQITGESEFNEIFISEARVPARYIVGERNGGWKVLQTALAYERLIMGEGATERQGKEKGAEPPLIQLARKHGKLQDPVLRQKMAQAIAYRQLNALNMQRAKAEILANGSSSLMSLGKLAMSRIQHGEARVAADILGAASLLHGKDHPDSADMNFDSAKAYMNSIGGGSDQIQRNIISERVLGLPREFEVDRNMPFRDVKSG
ncbi:Acyl-CoA dehydrogenase [Parasphingorhabdus marina DSM 22363]|uniref:Acyl-CoA dehydrogenase n=1 Tax=Parasphingorhabdus marina DSM 22363 TaxID=1123272 RepID=A0A1N6DG33_9SPHN|nr:acyl-CoA dehydrogenase family protein [Parasphingorhabdus marina]SIN69677.1 Acyl-CoA dehydrogenase [Parasphingorhabdus marina DSM 22363]